ncbi:hypothetical protein [Sporomusa aerivorans]|uniref:hypothetical protein n=1 Tax=Sporomusa aerivorans TaxID=204936 RepID=UPI00352ABA19
MALVLMPILFLSATYNFGFSALSIFLIGTLFVIITAISSVAVFGSLGYLWSSYGIFVTLAVVLGFGFLLMLNPDYRKRLEENL